MGRCVVVCATWQRSAFKNVLWSLFHKLMGCRTCFRHELEAACGCQCSGAAYGRISSSSSFLHTWCRQHCKVVDLGSKMQQLHADAGWDGFLNIMYRFFRCFVRELSRGAPCRSASMSLMSSSLSAHQHCVRLFLLWNQSSQREHS